MVSMDIDGALTSVLKLFPDVTEHVLEFQQTKPDRYARNLARRLKTEEALYQNFTCQLFSLSPRNSQEKGGKIVCDIESRLGQAAAESLTTDLWEMEGFLRDLKADLVILGRGSEVLAKLKHEAVFSRGALPKAPLDKRLDDLSRTNRYLSDYLLHDRVSLPLARQLTGSLHYLLLMQSHRLEKTATTEVTCKRIIGNGGGAISSRGDHPTSHHSRSSRGYKDLKDDSFSQNHTSTNTLVSIKTLDLDQEHDNESNWETSSSINTDEEEGREISNFESAQNDKDRKTFSVSFKNAPLPPTSVSLEEVILRRSLTFNQKRRMELAFRLSLAIVLLLWSAPDMMHSSKWGDWTVRVTFTQSDRLSKLYFSPKHSWNDPEIYETQGKATAFLVQTRDPVLSLLGLRLIEIAFGQTLAEISNEDIKLVTYDESLDENARDLLVAKRILATHIIEKRFSKDYEDVVNICLNQQYREIKGANVTNLDSREPSFLERATTSILMPLYHEMRKYIEFDSTQQPANGGSPQEHKETKPAIKSGLPNGDDVIQLSISSYISGEKVPMPHGPGFGSRHGANDQPLSPSSASNPSIGNASTGFSSGNPQTKSQKPVVDQNLGDSQQWSSDKAQVTGDSGLSQSQKAGDTADPSTQPDSESYTAARNKMHNTTASSYDELRSVEEPTSKDYSELDSNESDCSNDAPPTTLDSAFGWQSEYTEESPKISDNHPYMKLLGLALFIMRKNFQAWKAHGDGQNMSSSSKIPYRGQASRKKTNLKRERQGNESDEDEDMDDDGSALGPDGPNKRRTGKTKALTLSCPFYKKDPRQHQTCCKFILKRIRDVKQHLNRWHRMPSYCARCNKTFESEDARDEHIRNVICEPQVPQKPEGISEDQKRQLSRKVSSSQDEKLQWFSIFDILFPDHDPRPETAYIDVDLLQNVQRFQDFSAEQGPQIIQRFLESCNAVQWINQPNELDAEGFRNRVIEAAIREISNAWARMASDPVTRETASNPMAPTSPSLQGNSQQIYGSQASNSSRPILNFGPSIGFDATQAPMMTTPSYIASYTASTSSAYTGDTGEEWFNPPASNTNPNTQMGRPGQGQGFVPSAPMPMPGTQDHEMFGNFADTFNFSYGGHSGGHR